MKGQHSDKARLNHILDASEKTKDKMSEEAISWDEKLRA